MDSQFCKVALKQKYKDSKWFYMTEVKNWPSRWAKQLRILDWVAVLKTRDKSKSRVHWFEIKVSRSDFKSDNKRWEYLKYCTNFFFVCPEWLIKKDELPEWVGLMYVQEDYTIKTVKRAKTNYNIDIPKDFRTYLVYSKIWKKEEYNKPWRNEWSRNHRMEFIEKYIESNRYETQLWSNLKTHMSKRISEMSIENNKYKHLKEKYDECNKYIKTLYKYLPEWCELPKYFTDDAWSRLNWIMKNIKDTTEGSVGE